ncbi:MAG TPA: hypothetical protein VGL49_07275 [Acidimicrobiales bacterium]
MTEAIEEHATALADAIEAALPGWITGNILRVAQAQTGEVSPELATAAAGAGRQVQTQTGPAIRDLLASDIDAQRTTPLALLRQAVRVPTQVLRDAGMVPVARDRFAREAFPDDDYDLSPASWADIDPSLTELGITWGAAKAFEHRRRHRSPGD